MEEMKQESLLPTEEQEQPTEEEEQPVLNEYGYTEEEWKAPIFVNGPTRQEVEEWKEKHGEVFFTPFDQEYYVWRVLTRPEYRTLINDKTLTAMDREEAMTEICVLFPRNFTREKMKANKAGIPSLLSEMIMDKSGFVASSAPIKL
jgi:hypothetical protein